MNITLPRPAVIRQQWTRALDLPHLRALVVVGLVATVVSLIILLMFWRKLPPVIPLWYSRPWGEDQLASPWNLLILPAASLLAQGVSLTLASTWSQTPLFAKLLILSSTIVALLSLITIINILVLVI